MTEHVIEQASKPASATKAAKTPAGPRSTVLRNLISRPKGATVAQIQRQMGWQRHTVRAAISRLRSNGVSIELDQSGRVARYRLVPGEDQ